MIKISIEVNKNCETLATELLKKNPTKTKCDIQCGQRWQNW